ncbi:MAG TPA: hypothetical protein VHR39_13450 [Propionibacteriaceae bacterium]|nr:hypothetical protein [Propionibacteriaceae bacterium]
MADSLRGRRTVLDPLRRAAGTEGARRYLDKAEPYRDVNVFLFEHGTRSPGIATPDDFQAVVRKHGATVYFDGWIHDASRMTLARSVATVGSSINCRGHGIRGVRCLSRTRYTGSQTRVSR